MSNLKIVSSDFKVVTFFVTLPYMIRLSQSSPAGVTEVPVRGGLIGELFANILADGFSRSRDGDRFYFEGSQSGLNQGELFTNASPLQFYYKFHNICNIINTYFILYNIINTYFILL